MKILHLLIVLHLDQSNQFNIFIAPISPDRPGSVTKSVSDNRIYEIIYDIN